jgi:hypothetical protein
VFRRSSRSHGRRVHLGAPVIAVNPSGVYLRHRVAAARAQRARRRAMWRIRLLLVAGLALLYFAIGRDLLMLGRARLNEASMSVRKDVHGITHDLKRLIRTSRLSDSTPVSPVAFTSAAALVNAADPDGLDDFLSDQPVEAYSRAE